MARPTRLKSELAATSPVTAAPAGEAPPPATPSPPPTAPPQSRPAAAGKVNKARVGPYLSEDQADRLRACYVHGWLQDNQGSFSDMLEAFLVDGAQAIERDNNGGKPWPPLGAGAIKSVSQMNIEAGRRATRG